MTADRALRLHPGHALLAALGLLCLLLLARLLLAERPPLPSMPAVAPPAMADPALLASRDMFFGAAGASGDSLPVTALPFRLHGLRTDFATGRGGAIIAGPDGQQESHAVGDDLGDGVTLVAIAVDHVVLERAGQREALWLDTSGDTPPQRFDPGPAPPADARNAPVVEAQPADPMEAPAGASGAADVPAAAPDSESSNP